MEKQYNMRWRSNDLAKLKKAVSGFNRLVTITGKKNPDIMNLLPEKIKVKELKELIDTRADYNREIRALMRFSVPEQRKIVSVKGTDVKATKWEVSQISSRIKRYVNPKREKRIELIKSTPVTALGRPRGYTKGEIGIGDLDINQFNPLSVKGGVRSTTDVHKKFKSVLAESQRGYYRKSDYRWKDNYIKFLKETYGSDADDIYNRVENMDIEQFLNTMYGEENINIRENYPVNKDDSKNILDRLRLSWGLPITETLFDEET